MRSCISVPPRKPMNSPNTPNRGCPISLTTALSLTSRARIGTGGAVTEVYVSVPRSEPSGATAVTMRHGVPVSDALRNDRPSQVPAYLCAGPADVDVRDPSPGAHAARTMAVQSSVRMCRLRYVSRMEYERSDGPTQGSGLRASRRQARRRSSQPATAANTTYAPSAVTAAAPSLDGGGPKNT